MFNASFLDRRKIKNVFDFISAHVGGKMFSESSLCNFRGFCSASSHVICYVGGCGQVQQKLQGTVGVLSWSVRQLLELVVFSVGCAQVRNLSKFVVIILTQISRSSCNVLGSSMSSLGTRGLSLVNSSLNIISLFVSMELF